MTEYLLDKTRQLKREGNDYSILRTYLENSGVSDGGIKAVFRTLDNEEIHELYQKQQLSKVRAELIGSIIILGFASIFNVYKYNSGDGFDIFTTVAPISLFIFFYVKFKRIRSKTYSAHQILKESRK